LQGKNKKMKNILVIAGLCLLTACNQNDAKPTLANNGVGQTPSPFTESTSLTQIQWLDSVNVDLGTITEGQVPELSWKFKNVGTEPLIIENTSVSCGCTIAEKPEQPIMPGEQGIIKAKFNSDGKPGPNNKQVTVFANTKDTRQHVLQFSVLVNSKK
jgi:hypothetical protein